VEDIQMKISMIWIALLLLFAAPTRGQTGSLPMMSSVDPLSGRPGDVMTARGDHLGADTVAALYLTDGTIDIKVEIVEQTTTLLKFKIPRAVKPGRLALMVLTSGKEGRLIEEPVKITIEPETTAR
jgi:hypothetical protein